MKTYKKFEWHALDNSNRCLLSTQRLSKGTRLLTMCVRSQSISVIDMKKARNQSLTIKRKLEIIDKVDSLSPGRRKISRRSATYHRVPSALY